MILRLYPAYQKKGPMLDPSKLRKLRISKGFSQVRLGDATGLGAPYLSFLESNGLVDARLSTLERLSRCLNVRLTELLTPGPASARASIPVDRRRRPRSRATKWPAPPDDPADGILLGEAAEASLRPPVAPAEPAPSPESLTDASPIA